jgi:hypothetical protein
MGTVYICHRNSVFPISSKYPNKFSLNLNSRIGTRDPKLNSNYGKCKRMKKTRRSLTLQWAPEPDKENPEAARGKPLAGDLGKPSQSPE